MAKKIRPSSGVIDCACVIHSTGYDWVYVEHLYNMLTRHLPMGIRFHVYTEHDRSVPAHMIKHCLADLPVGSGPKRSWWHKMQLFNPEHHTGNLLYFDLDTVIVRDISWIVQNNPRYLWGCRDFRYLQNQAKGSLNSSIMWWNVLDFAWLWERFSSGNMTESIKRYHGDQDYIWSQLGHTHVRYLNDKAIKSFRWQCMNGGYDFARRHHRAPGTGVCIDGETDVVVFHGLPKPHQVQDPVIRNLWC